MNKEVLYPLLAVQVVVRDAVEDGIAVIKSREDDRVCNCVCSVANDEWANMAE